ncbi:MAG: S-layer homology domain-containing protein, partial [Firmicutes bacterium]|nr:S-layer homology domain-containing protein [Bacillota bacterium]
DIVWTSTNPDIVSFLYLDEMTLRIDGLKPGTTVITAACSALKTSASCTVTVLEEDTENNVEEVEEEQPMPTITVVKPSKDGSPVTVPVDNITSGTVAFIVYEDGTEQLLKTCYVDGDDLKVRIDENATLKIVDNKKTFNDLKQGAWYNSAVDSVSARGLMNGTSTTQFSPSVTVNHAMAWTMLANLNDQPISGSSPWYDKSRTWAMENNLTDGSDATGTIERQELATLLWKQAGSPNSTRGFDGFVDADQIDAENVVAMQWALENGIMAGKTGGKMDPTGSTTRAEIAQMFKNFVSSDAYR